MRKGPIPGGLTAPEPVRETPGGGLIILSFPMISPLRCGTLAFFPNGRGSDHCPGRAFPDLGLGDRTRDFGRPAKGEVFQAGTGAACKGWANDPNPMVGALIVERGEVVAEGYHRACGEPHAEIEAFASLGREPGTDAAMFVSLEPCSTHMETPPCTAILSRESKRVRRSF